MKKLILLAGLTASSTALAQDNTVVTDVVLSDGTHLDIEAHTPHALDFATWLGNLALDGPGSGGPGDIPPEIQTDIQVLENVAPLATAEISNGLLYLSDPAYEVQILDAKQAAQPAHQEDAMGMVVTDLLIEVGAPIDGPVIVHISNGV